MWKQPMILLRGNGSDLSNRKVILRKAKCKIITQKTMLRLIDVAKERGAKDRVKAYWNTYYCQNKVITTDGKLFTNYCKNRFCTSCCGIRKAELIKNYLPVLQSWKDSHFVTLTVKAVMAIELQKRIEQIKQNFRLIKDKYRKRSQRGTGNKLIGFKTIECNFNPKSKTYNPHIHLLVPSKAIAIALINEWLAIWTSEFARRDAQHYRKVKDCEKDLIEVIKYETKIFTEPDPGRGTPKGGNAMIYVRALDNIYTALKGFRIVDRFGFSLSKHPKGQKAECKFVDEYQKWEYHSKSMDWLNEEHESTLTAYEPPQQLIDTLEFNIDTVLE